MKTWARAACLIAGAGLSFALVAQQPGGTRPGVVVDINPGRILLMDVTRAGDRLVTVGERGFTLVSDDAGQSWRAVATPVTRSLTRVAFENDKLGVAVGHGGSIVRTEDGGETWTAVAVEEAGVDSLLGVTSLGVEPICGLRCLRLVFHVRGRWRHLGAPHGHLGGIRESHFAGGRGQRRAVAGGRVRHARAFRGRRAHLDRGRVALRGLVLRRSGCARRRAGDLRHARQHLPLGRRRRHLAEHRDRHDHRLQRRHRAVRRPHRAGRQRRPGRREHG